MKRQFKRKLCLRVEVESTLVMEDSTAAAIQLSEQSRPHGKRLSLRELQSVTLDKVDFQPLRTFERMSVRVITKPMKIVGTPSTSLDISTFVKSTSSIEMSYLKDNLESAIKELIEILRKECRAGITTHQLHEDDYAELSDSLNSPDMVESEPLEFLDIPDKFRFNKDKRIRELTSGFGSTIRKRLNPSKKKLPKSEERITSEQVKARKKLQKAIGSLLRDNERITKADVARKLAIGSEKNRTQALVDWLKVRKLVWATERDEAIRKFKT